MFEVMLGRGGKPKVESMFVGEVPSSEFITGDALASQIGLTAGVSQHSTSGWLHFEDDGKVKYISKRPLRHTISWDSIHSRGAVFGTAQVVINGLTYKVRLLSGANSNPATSPTTTFDHHGTWGCEWNRLMYRISAKPFNNPSNTLESEGITEGNWASYPEDDLLTHNVFGNGTYNWCQETGTTGTTRVSRGGGGASYLSLPPSNNIAQRGWRPVLELVE